MSERVNRILVEVRYEMQKVERLIHQLVTRMVEIDAAIAPSMYNKKALDYTATPADAPDRRANNEDYSLLWDAILDECNELCPGVLDEKMDVYRRK